jgi:hypothetical protein
LDAAQKALIAETNGEFNGTCVYWNRNNSRWQQDGCWVQSSNQTAVICACTHLTEFAIQVQPIRAAPKPSGGGSGISVGAIVGSVVGVLAVGLAGFGLVKRQRAKRMAEDSRIAPTAMTDAEDGAGVGAGVGAAGAVFPLAINATLPGPIRQEASTLIAGSPDDKMIQTSPTAYAAAKAEAMKHKPVRDPKLLPKYQFPPSYEDHMARKAAREAQAASSSSSSSQY